MSHIFWQQAVPFASCNEPAYIGGFGIKWISITTLELHCWENYNKHFSLPFKTVVNWVILLSHWKFYLWLGTARVTETFFVVKWTRVTEHKKHELVFNNTTWLTSRTLWSIKYCWWFFSIKLVAAMFLYF